MAKINRRNAAKFLARVPGGNVFRCNDGYIISDMKELAQVLGDMSDQTFAYHANETKNDFANWVADVMGDQELASNLRMAADRMRAARLVAERVTFLDKKAS